MTEDCDYISGICQWVIIICF